MSAKNLETLLADAKKALGNRKQLAIFGASSSGKTVFTTLTKRAIFRGYLEKNPDTTAHVERGNEFLEASEKAMLSGKFPDRTQLDVPDEIVITMRGKGFTGTKKDLRILDISGETYEKLCVDRIEDPKVRIQGILEKGIGKTEKFGPLSFMILARMYVILLDCDEFDDWPKKDSRYSRGLTAIRHFKQVSDDETNDQVKEPIAIVLTKSDTLPQMDETDPEKIIKKYLPEFHNSLRSIHSGKRGFFKVSVDVQRNADNQVAQSGENTVKLPLTYTEDEYVRFITWVTDNMS